MQLTVPRFVIAGLAGDSGKTLVSLGMARALVGTGVDVAPLKKGPDYIDAGWLGAAAGKTARNLDTFMEGPAGVGEAVARSLPADLLLVEGNRGLFDGMDAAGTHSTAALAKLLGAAVILVVDVTKMTRTTAAVIRGCQLYEPELEIAGVILNRVGTRRQEKLIREAIAAAGGPPVLGAVPRLHGADPLPGRHLGLVTAQEHPSREAVLERVASVVRRNVDLRSVVEVAEQVAPVELERLEPAERGDPVRIAVFRDETFTFFYPENLEALEEAGADLVFISPRDDRPIPDDVDALYIGGGFPELAAAELAGARRRRTSVKEAAKRGLPVYAECGGLMLLARELVAGNNAYPMVGALDLVVEQTDKPCGHGYVEGVVDRDNPFLPKGTAVRGHEFHYSRVIGGDTNATALCLDRGTGVGKGRDGVVRGASWASYTHIHAFGVPEWARGLLAEARRYRSRRGAAVAWA